MKEIKTDFKNSHDGYYMVKDPKGVLRCSCGRELEQLDEHTWRCSAGWPVYRSEDGEIIRDKFGNVMFKVKEHDESKSGEKWKKERDD